MGNPYSLFSFKHLCLSTVFLMLRCTWAVRNQMNEQAAKKEHKYTRASNIKGRTPNTSNILPRRNFLLQQKMTHKIIAYHGNGERNNNNKNVIINISVQCVCHFIFLQRRCCCCCCLMFMFFGGVHCTMRYFGENEYVKNIQE